MSVTLYFAGYLAHGGRSSSSGGNAFVRWAEHAAIWRWVSMLTRDCYNVVGFGGALTLTAVVIGAFFLWRYRDQVSAALRRSGGGR
ncbi:hypothetical protein [Mycobacteroides abscessus]|uniref:hypothetical protein n=1 Tax=Mycobacteroides abscessus TaxID=36809 RepID=UPI00092A206B|nr:hypothetical protein [Mycobacteroides abscessus]SHQ46962.1 Uncharacterised protein [Mycobacteroides abscessus subsp. abscessus]SKQ86488.1 Uncharacterised protein [Mycobacteroides abscessus subsp. massiliense]SLC48127.1 Uncharacterised protein [Mycobacteroides abscessus subsp. massiliense]